MSIRHRVERVGRSGVARRSVSSLAAIVGSGITPTWTDRILLPAPAAVSNEKRITYFRGPGQGGFATGGRGGIYPYPIERPNPSGLIPLVPIY